MLIPFGMVMLRICLPDQRGFGLRMAGVGTVPSQLGTHRKKVLHLGPFNKAILKGKLANSTKGVLHNTHDGLVCLGRNNSLHYPCNLTELCMSLLTLGNAKWL